MYLFANVFTLFDFFNYRLKLHILLFISELIAFDLLKVLISLFYEIIHLHLHESQLRVFPPLFFDGCAWIRCFG